MSDNQQASETPERPDDSGEFDDETLETIIRDSISIGITDPILGRDLRWLTWRLDQRIAELERTLDSQNDHAQNGPHDGCACPTCFAWREGWPHGNRLSNALRVAVSERDAALARVKELESH